LNLLGASLIWVELHKKGLDSALNL
jgi:hypothetical protein